jgi:hypothetical protein
VALHESLLTTAAPPATGPDAALIRACNAFAAIEIRRQAPSFTDEQEERIQKTHRATFGRMFQHRATTPAGFAARARALALYAYPGETGEWPHAMIALLLRDMLGLPDDVEGIGW